MDLLNVLLLLPWIYCASTYESEAYQNLATYRIRRWLNGPVAWLERTIPHCTTPAACATLFVGVLLLGGPLWVLYRPGILLGMEVLGMEAMSLVLPVMVLSRFTAFLAQLSALRLLLVWREGRGRESSLCEFLGTATEPVPRFRDWQGQILATTGLFVLSALLAVGASVGFGGGVLAELPRAAVQALISGIVMTVFLLRNLLLYIVIGSIAGSVLRWPALQTVSNEWCNAISRATFGRPIAVGFIDITPLLLFLALDYLVIPILARLVG